MLAATSSSSNLFTEPFSSPPRRRHRCRHPPASAFRSRFLPLLRASSSLHDHKRNNLARLGLNFLQVSMSEAAQGATSDQPNRMGPDFFGYFAREIDDLLLQDEDSELLDTSPEANDAENACKVLENGKGGDLYRDKPPTEVIADSVSGEKKEVLRALLKESIKTLSHEVEEILDPVVRLRHHLSHLRSRERTLTMEAECNGKATERPCKKLKRELSSSDKSNFEPVIEVDKDLQRLLESEDGPLVKQIMDKHADEFALTLKHMEQQLNAILDAATSRCRTMTSQEKQRLTASIQKLPRKNLDRVAEIVVRDKPSTNPSSNEVSVDLENEDNKTIWRLHFYVKAVENARELCGVSS